MSNRCYFKCDNEMSGVQAACFHALHRKGGCVCSEGKKCG